ncbi:MAG: hypothetical protein PHO66_04400 [Eubacteriales bacterium]|nr:hypothetical protein [Eubacteriales bacterium]
MLPVIAVNAQMPGLLLVNGSSAGDIGPQEWVTLPIAAQGRCYLHYLPAQNDTQSCSVRFDVQEGVLALPREWDVPLTMIQWPSGVHEITFYPRSQPAQAQLPLAPEILSRLDMDSLSAALVRYGTLWMVIEQDEQTVLSQALPGAAQAGTLKQVGGNIAALGQTDEGQWGAVFRPAQEGWEQAAYEAGDTVQLEGDGTLRAQSALGDIAGHSRVVICRATGYAREQSIVYAQGRARDLTDPRDIAQAFLQACALGEYREATAYLSTALQRQVSGSALREFVGEVYTCGPARYSPPVGQEEVAMAIFRKSDEHVLQALPLAFAFVDEGGRPRIDDIRPL